MQIKAEADKFGGTSKIKSTCLYGGASKGPQLRDLENGVEIWCVFVFVSVCFVRSS